MSDDRRCTNRIAAERSRGYSRRCQRDSTGADGLCNICRAAQRRAEEHHAATLRERDARFERQARASQEARDLSAAARWIQEHRPEVWDEALSAVREVAR